jgi:23S rRNA pseudouridine2457 synthase
MPANLFHLHLRFFMTDNKPHRYFIVNKPYNMVSQFIGEEKVAMLGRIGYDFPEGIHAVGRLDSKSEGLLILTTNKTVTRLLFSSGVPHKRTYLVRVKNKVSPESLEQLRAGVTIRIKEGEYYVTPPCEIDIVENPENLFPHQRETREFVAHTWLHMSLYEGKFHQVRKMVFAINHRCLRLIRVSIEGIELGTLEPGGIREIEEGDFFRKLKIENWN